VAPEVDVTYFNSLSTGIIVRFRKRTASTVSGDLIDFLSHNCAA
jgi:hypothetical protein